MNYTNTIPNPEPKKDYRFVRLTDVSTGEALEGCVETQESMRRRLAWSRTAGPDQFRSLDIWMFQQGVK